jgi:hypothetical protein
MESLRYTYMPRVVKRAPVKVEVDVTASDLEEHTV